MMLNSEGLKQAGISSSTLDPGGGWIIRDESGELRRSYRMVMEAIGPVLIEKGILDAQELQELGEELRRVEEQDDVLCVWSPTFSVWVNRT